ncbi:MAG: hypothetical protein JSS62_01780 [Verrucomicrobia bacterium]|nr:hypothetical protein [Verrucomicrobiota bacterium]MBS0645661.1 hypothetical protein [Verrucomicrobiota bacterium]
MASTPLIRAQDTVDPSAISRCEKNTARVLIAISITSAVLAVLFRLFSGDSSSGGSLSKRQDEGPNLIVAVVLFSVVSGVSGIAGIIYGYWLDQRPANLNLQA